MKKRLSVFSKLFSYTIIIVGFFCAGSVDAATMSLRPSSTKIEEGSTFTVTVSIDTQGETINNAEAIISYPKDVLEVVSLASSPSIFNLWAEGPSFSNTNGTINFNGGVPNPGYTGSGGRVLSATLRAKKIGLASISLGGVAIRANDGLGTDIFSGQKNTSIEVTQKTEVPPPKNESEETKTTTTKPAPPVETTITSTQPAAPVEEKNTAPEIIYYTTSISQGEQIQVQGTSRHPNATISFVLKSEYGRIYNYDVVADGNGSFAFKSEPMSVGGNFELYVYSTDVAGVKSPISKIVHVTVTEPIKSQNLSTLNIPALPVIVVSIIILLVALNIFSLYKVFSLKRQYGHMEQKSRKVFKLLIDRASKQIDALEKTKKNGSLTSQGQAAVKELREVIQQLEDFEDSEKV